MGEHIRSLRAKQAWNISSRVDWATEIFRRYDNTHRDLPPLCPVKMLVNGDIYEFLRLPFHFIVDRWAATLFHLEDYNYPAPRLVFIDQGNKFLVRNPPPGQPLSTKFTPYSPLLGWQIYLIGIRLKMLHTLPLSPIFLSRESPDPLTEYCNRINDLENYSRKSATIAPNLHDALTPIAMEEFFGNYAEELLARQPVLCHGSLGPENILTASSPRTAVFNNWRNARIGDPLEDLAHHLHHMRYHPGQRKYVEAVYYRASGLKCGERTFLRQIKLYEDLEKTRTFLVSLGTVGNDVCCQPSYDSQLTVVTRFWVRYAEVCRIFGIPVLSRDLIFQMIRENYGSP